VPIIAKSQATISAPLPYRDAARRASDRPQTMPLLNSEAVVSRVRRRSKTAPSCGDAGCAILGLKIGNVAILVSAVPDGQVSPSRGTVGLETWYWPKSQLAPRPGCWTGTSSTRMGKKRSAVSQVLSVLRGGAFCVRGSGYVADSGMGPSM
jgi:hypothetical protein